jgi:hypothetical protein
VSAIERATATRHYLLDATLLVAPRLQVANREVVPQAGIGIGTTVSNPAVDSLTTHSQNTWGWLVGVDAQLVGPISLGVQLRRLSVRLQDVTSTAPSTPGVSTGVTAIVGRVGVRF